MKRFLMTLALLTAMIQLPDIGNCMGRKSQPGDVPPLTVLTQGQREAIDRLMAEAGPATEIKWDAEYGVPSFISGSLRVLSGDQDAAVLLYLDEFRDLFKMERPASEFTLKRTESDQLGMVHLRYQQIYKNLPIIGQELLAHINAAGMLQTLNGHPVPTLAVDVSPRLDSQSACRIATEIALEKKPGNKIDCAEKLGILMVEGKAHLVWEIELSSTTNLSIGEYVYVDAHTGAVLKRLSTIHSDGPAIGDGIGVLGQTRQLFDYQIGTTYRLFDASRPMYVPPIEDLNGVIVTLDAHNTEGSNVTDCIDPNNDNHWNDSDYLRPMVDAHYHIGQTYQFFRTVFNRNSYDNNGSSLVSLVHFGQNSDNAAWHGGTNPLMEYGDGGTIMRATSASYDATVHEVSHGVTNASSGLQYLRQSGAINESFSDVMACVADSGDWLIGEDIVIVFPYYLRSLEAPWLSFDWQPYAMNQYQNLPDSVDHGGVHVNSGIPNFVFYLAASYTNRLQAGMIWYRANTLYLTPTSQFLDLRNACLQAATDLYGPGSFPVAAVNDAFFQVGLGGSNPPGCLVYEGFESDAQDWTVADVDNDGQQHWAISGELFRTGVRSGLCFSSIQGEWVQEVLLSGAFQVPQGAGSATLSYSTLFIGAEYANDNHYIKVGSNLNDYFSWPIVQTLTPQSMQQIDNSWAHQSVTVPNLVPGTSYYLTFEYRGTDADNWYLDDIALAVALEGDEAPTAIPLRSVLLSAFPNPFNATSTISYDLASSSRVELSLWNILGERVQILEDLWKPAGSYQVSIGEGLQSGSYFVRLKSKDNEQVQRVVLIK